jgi:hypothetical protein
VNVHAYYMPETRWRIGASADVRAWLAFHPTDAFRAPGGKDILTGECSRDITDLVVIGGIGVGGRYGACDVEGAGYARSA